MKTIYLILGALAVIALAFFIGQSYKGEEKGLQASVVSINQKDSFFNIRAEYPQFKTASKEFNSKISKLIEDRISQFKKESQDNWQARRATDSSIPENPDVPFDFIAAWSPAQLNDKYLSFSLTTYYFSGGAHGATLIDAFNYDVKQNKEITIEDLIGKGNLDKFSQLAKQEVQAQLQGAGLELDESINQMIEQGTSSNLDNYQNFNFNSNAVIVYFQQYQVAPGYLNILIATIYKQELEQNSVSSPYLE